MHMVPLPAQVVPQTVQVVPPITQVLPLAVHGVPTIMCREADAHVSRTPCRAGPCDNRVRCTTAVAGRADAIASCLPPTDRRPPSPAYPCRLLYFMKAWRLASFRRWYKALTRLSKVRWFRFTKAASAGMGNSGWS